MNAHWYAAVVLVVVYILLAACTFDTSGLKEDATIDGSTPQWVDSSMELSADQATLDLATPDQSTPDQAAPDQSTPDQAAPDQSTPDQAAPDQAAPDLQHDASPCVSVIDPQTLMLLDFEGIVGNMVPDVTGKHPGTLQGSQATQVPGPVDCGTALQIPAALSGGSYVEVGNDPDWELAQGSVDLWVRFDSPLNGSDFQGIISRDAGGQNEPGHLSIFRSCNGLVVVRLQDATNSYIQCSAAVGEGQWMHLGVNFGGSQGLQLFVDGQLANETTSATFSSYDSPCTSSSPCNTSTTKGIEGNSNPWVIGATSMNSQDGQAKPVYLHLGGALDHVRISSVRRDFGAGSP